jgi:RimJ/RimL family protein N-acetyltransferase
VDGYLIGDMELDHICWSKREAELRIRIGEKEFWGKGFGSEALHLILNHIFYTKNFYRIYLRVYSFNKRAINCYLKNGFKPIGLLHRVNQDWKDIILMEIKGTKFQKMVNTKIAG